MKFFAYLLMLSASTASAFALTDGANSSGGGGAYVCRDSSNQIVQSHLVDLWESAHIPFAWPGLSQTTISVLLTNGQTVDDLLGQSIARLRNIDFAFAGLVEAQLDHVRSNQNFLPADTSIQLPSDLNTDYFPTGCRPEGMMRYNGVAHRLDIDRSIFDKLETNSDIAAAYLHEAIYNVYRGSGEVPRVSNSIFVRRLVGCLFSEECIASADFTPAPKAVVCEAPGILAYAYPKQNSGKDGRLYGWELRFTEFGSNRFDRGVAFYGNPEADQRVVFKGATTENSWLSAFKFSQIQIGVASLSDFNAAGSPTALTVWWNKDPETPYFTYPNNQNNRSIPCRPI